LTSDEIKLFRGTSVYTLLDHKRNEDILEELKAEPVREETKKIRV